MIERTLTQSELLSIWERGEGQRPSRRALALLEGAAPDSDAAELAALPVGSRDAMLLDLREHLFGAAVSGITSCPACAEEIELSFDIGEVRRDRAVESPRLRIADGEYEVQARLPSTADLGAIEQFDDLSLARGRLFSLCVVGATRGSDPVAAELLPPPVVEAVVARMAEADPQADVQVDAECPACGERWREPFDIVTYLFTELSVFARRLLADVHDIAAAYGWSEAEILALSPARRNAYLEMLR